MKKIFLLVGTKLIILILVSFIVKSLFKSIYLFSFPDVLRLFHLPEFIEALGNFDGAQYLKIAKQGYYQYGYAFFPLYPLSIRTFGIFVDNNYTHLQPVCNFSKLTFS